jgi:hypothetical protein
VTIAAPDDGADGSERGSERRLKHLRKLFVDGLLTEVEYAAKRTEIIDAL